MKLLRKLFRLNTIYSRDTGEHVLHLYGLITFFGYAMYIGLVSESSDVFTWIFFSPLPIMITLIVARVLVRGYIAKKIVRPFKNKKLYGSAIHTPTASLELDNLDALYPIAQYKNAHMYYAEYEYHQQTRGGSYLAIERYYTVYEATLIRQLPHLVFDSKKAKKRQFKFIYHGSQKIGLEGNFDQHFETYSPQEYHIDTLSFITPEVMQAFIDVSPYCDIEIVGNKLLLYAPLLADYEIAAFEERGRYIASHINDNIDNYRDDRLHGDERKSDVTSFAKTLMRSYTKKLVLAIVFGALTFGILLTGLLTLDWEVIFNWGSAFVYMIFLASIIEVKTIRKQNERIKAQQKK